MDVCATEIERVDVLYVMKNHLRGLWICNKRSEPVKKHFSFLDQGFGVI